MNKIKNNLKEAEIVEETLLANPQGKTVEELKQIAQTLQAQLQEHQKEANRHNMMGTKAQGALEVILQLIPKVEVNKMIAEEKKSNGELSEG